MSLKVYVVDAEVSQLPDSCFNSFVSCYLGRCRQGIFVYIVYSEINISIGKINKSFRHFELLPIFKCWPEFHTFSKLFSLNCGLC